MITQIAPRGKLKVVQRNFNDCEAATQDLMLYLFKANEHAYGLNPETMAREGQNSRIGLKEIHLVRHTNNRWKKSVYRGLYNSLYFHNIVQMIWQWYRLSKVTNPQCCWLQRMCYIKRRIKLVMGMWWSSHLMGKHGHHRQRRVNFRFFTKY